MSRLVALVMMLVADQTGYVWVDPKEHGKGVRVVRTHVGR
jgi:hypothetical protein